MRKTTVWIVLIAMSVFGVSPTVRANITEDEQWSSPFTATPGLHGIELLENPGARTNVSLLTGQVGNDTKICAAVSDQSCVGDVQFQAVLAPCANESSNDCIVSVEGLNSAGVRQAGEFSRQFPTRGVNEYQGSSAELIPDGSSPSLWSLPSFEHTNGSLYHVAVQVMGRRLGGSATSTPRAVAATVTPVSILQTSCDVQFHGTCMDQFAEVQRNGRTVVDFSGVAHDQDIGVRCVGWAENGLCALKHAFPADMRVRITLRLSTVPGGWLHGRLVDPVASIVSKDAVTTMTVEAAPTEVPAVAAMGQYSQLPSDIRSWFDTNCPAACGTRLPGSESAAPAQRNAVSNPLSYRETSFDQLRLWTNQIGDKASAVPSYWSVRTLSDQEMQVAPSCIKNGVGVTGIVSTNATLYSEGPPAFDRSTRTLDYKVAAPHYLANGTTEFLGRYDLLLRPDIASCLYGINDLAVTSEIDVIAEDGSEKPVNVSMTRSTEWFKFSAAGFTYSAPVIKVKLAKLVPTLRRNKTIKLSTLRKRVALKVPRGAQVTTSVSRASRSRCAVRGARLVALKKTGTCKVTMRVTPKKTKSNKKPKTIKRTFTVRIR